MSKSYVTFKNENYIIQGAPQSILDITNKYVEDCDELAQWFKENYTETGNKSDFIKFIDIWSCFKSSSLYTNMNSYEKRKITKKKMIENVSVNPTLKKYYKIRAKINGKTLRNIIIGFVPYVEESDDESDDDEDIIESEVILIKTSNDSELFSDDDE